MALLLVVSSYFMGQGLELISTSNFNLPLWVLWRFRPQRLTLCIKLINFLIGSGGSFFEGAAV